MAPQTFREWWRRVTAAREAVLARIREALGDGVPPPTVPRDYVTRGSSPPDVVVARFVEWVEEAGAQALLRADDTATTVAAVLAQHGASRVVVAPDLAVDLRPVGVDLVEDGELHPAAPDALDGAVTTCSVACASTGSIALDGGPGQGRRAITLVPDLHVCIVRPDQIVETVPEFLARLQPTGPRGQADRDRLLVRRPPPTSASSVSRACTARVGSSWCSSEGTRRRLWHGRGVVSLGRARFGEREVAGSDPATPTPAGRGGATVPRCAARLS